MQFHELWREISLDPDLITKRYYTYITFHFTTDVQKFQYLLEIQMKLEKKNT